MRLLVDTHVLLWAFRPSRRASKLAAVLSDLKNEVSVSAASIWEVEIKRKLGKLRAPGDLLGAIRETELQVLPIAAEHGVAAGRLPLHHRDPFDRMLVAQAKLEGLTLVTADERLRRYEIPILAAAV